MLTYTNRMSLGFSLPGAPDVPTVVAYLRSRPSEGSASDEAMSMQRELLAEMTRRGEIAVVAEFIEVEGASDDRPTYRAAYKDAVSRGCALFTAGWGAIGMGPRFEPPDMAEPGGVETMEVSVSYVRFADLVSVPAGAPALVALWADYRRPQGVTAIYLCNAGPDRMDAVALTSRRYEIGIEGECGGGDMVLEPILGGMARLVTTLFHDEWTFYSHYRLSYVQDGMPQKVLRANDGPLNSEWLMQDPSKPWVRFYPDGSRSVPAEAPAK